MNATSSRSRDDAHARLQGKRAAHGVVIVVAVAFVGASAAQIIPAVFGTGIRPVPSTSDGSPEHECVHGVRSLGLALDRASEQAWSTPVRADDDSPLDAFRRSLVPEWNAQANIERACARSREGLAAWAALLRLRTAEENVVLPLRRDVTAHLPAELR
jgi:hypothetical protein